MVILKVKIDPDNLHTLLQNVIQQENTRQQVQINRDTSVGLCDSTNTAAVRLWIREITLAFKHVGTQYIIQIVTNTVSSHLRFEVERFIESYIDTHHVPRASVDWNALRDHVSNQFLNIDETQSLRDELENVPQSAHEPIPQYLRRFRETADVAYPPPSRTPDHQVIMIRAFARGLLSDIIARKLVEDIIPTDLDTAMQAVARLNERAEAYSRLKRYEEPMEIGMLNPPQVTPSSPHDGLQKQIQITIQYKMSWHRQPTASPKAGVHPHTGSSTQPPQLSTGAQGCLPSRFVSAVSPPIPVVEDGHEAEAASGGDRWLFTMRRH